MRTLAWIGLGAAVFLGAAALFLLWSHRGPEREWTQASLGEVRLIYAPGYARFALGKQGGRLDRLELATRLPGFQPAGNEARPLPAGDARGAPGLLFLSLSPVDPQTTAPSLRVASLYSSFLEPEAVEDSSGLVMRRFEDNSPYAGEDLFFDAPDGRLFAARCLRADPKLPPVPLTCIASLRAEGLDVEMRFGREALASWRAIADGASGLVHSMVLR